MKREPPAKRTLPMMPFYVRDYIAATRSLSLAERGAYTDLLFAEWDSGAALPRDPARLAAIVGCTRKEFAPLWQAIKHKFTRVAGGYINRRLEAEREICLDKHAKASGKAAAAAAARWNVLQETMGNASSNAPSIAPSMSTGMLGAMHKQCPPNPNPSPSEESQEATASRKRARPAGPGGPRARVGVIDESREDVQRRRRLAAELSGDRSDE